MDSAEIVRSIIRNSAEWRFRRQHGRPDQDHLLPQPGLYRVRLVRGGVYVPLRWWIVEHRCADTDALMADTRFHAEQSGEPLDDLAALEAWQRHGLTAEAIDQQEFDYLVATARHARQHQPNHPAADPRRRTDFLTAPPPF